MKKLQVLFFALAAILFIGTAQTATAQKRKPNKRTTTTSPRKKPTTTTQATINVNFKGELGLYELRGPVKQCIWKNDDSENNLGFDKNGMWVTENGYTLGGEGVVIKRDKAGRIIKRGDPYDEEYTSYTYNSNGLVTKKIIKYMDGGDEIHFYYNSNGECTKCVDSYGDMEGSGKLTTKYTIVTRDSYGNWTKRKDQHGKVETRIITYYK